VIPESLFCRIITAVRELLKAIVFEGSVSPNILQFKEAEKPAHMTQVEAATVPFGRLEAVHYIRKGAIVINSVERLIETAVGHAFKRFKRNG
jgi:hypothetical protein